MFSKTEMVKKPWLVQKTILDGMELRLNAALDKIENLSREVEINRMMEMYDKLMNQEHSEQMPAVVAEREFEYGAEAFEAYVKGNVGKVEVASGKMLELASGERSR